jgi:RHS repeat-associated protein
MLLADRIFVCQRVSLPEGKLTVITVSKRTVATDTYSALGQRVRDVTQTNTTDEAYGAGGELLWRYTGNSSDPNQRAFVPFRGRILAEYYGGSPGGTQFDHPDELGSLTANTSYNGSACQERVFYPYGEALTGAGNCGMHQTFAGLPDYDPEIDQYNTPARHYPAKLGRWLSPDWSATPTPVPYADLADPQSLNLYAYVRNNPTSRTDPDGHRCYSIGGCLGEWVNGIFFRAKDLVKRTRMLFEDPPPPPSLVEPPPKPRNPDPYYKPSANKPNTASALGKLIDCTNQCYMRPMRITSTDEPVREHPEGSVHRRGEAFDVTVPQSRIRELLQCGADCGAGYAQNEHDHPSSESNGGHVHIQTVPGKGGGRGDLPKPAPSPTLPQREDQNE